MLKRLPLSAVLALAATTIALNACQTAKPRSTGPRRSNSGGAVGAATVTYDGQIKPLLKANCESCHDGKSASDLTTYAKAKAAAATIETRMKLAKGAKGVMPTTGPLAAKDVALVTQWIKDGTPEKAAASGAVGTAVSYEGWAKGFLKDNCVACHAGSQAPDLSDYAGAKAAAKASEERMKRATGTAGVMPTSGRLDDAKIAKFSAWISGGLLEKDGDKSSPGIEGNDDDDDDQGGDGDAATDDDDATGGGVTYTGNIRGWVSDHCIACHGAGGSSPLLATKADVQNAAAQVLDSVENGRMPQGGTLDDDEIKLFSDWIDGGKR
jgi:mono/diheme cytochrome c family protein